MECDRCGKQIKSGTLCHDCSTWLEGYAQGSLAVTTEITTKFVDDIVSKLEELQKNSFQTSVYTAYGKAIEIVKAGGKNDD